MITVQAGESLWSIAQRELGDGNRWQEIAEANQIKNPRALQVGAQLNLPVAAPIPRANPLPDEERRTATTKKSRAMRVGNPMGIRRTVNTEGLGAKGELGDPGYLKFEDESAGVEAYSKYMLQLHRVGLQKTDEWVAETMEHFNPLTRTRIKEIADNALGVDPDELIDLSDPETQAKLAVVAMVANNKTVPVRPATVKAIAQKQMQAVERPQPDSQVRDYLFYKLRELQWEGDARAVEERAGVQGQLIEDLGNLPDSGNVDQAHKFSNQWRYGPGDQ